MRPWGRTYYLPLSRFEQRLDQVWIRHLHASAEALPDLHYRELKKPARFAVEAFFAMEKNPDGVPVALLPGQTWIELTPPASTTFS